jgi:hypothetical protein
MKTSITTARQCFFALFISAGLTGYSQALTTEFQNAGYTLLDLGSVDQLPSRYGGLTIRPDQPNTLYIGGYANEGQGNLYTVGLVRDAVTHHITGFDGAASLFVAAPNNDGGIFFAPNGTLLFTRYSMNHLGQVLPDNSYVTTPLTDFGIASSVGSIILVPAGYPGAGNLIVASYNGAILYNVPYTIDGSGLYILSNKAAEVSVVGVANGPEGIAYIPAGSLAFPNLSMAVSSYGDGTVMVFEVGADGLPIISTARQMVTGLTGAEGALIDPVTGDFLFSTFGGGDKVIRISGFEAPSAIGDKPAGSDAGFTLTPNPTEGTVKIEIAESGDEGCYEIYNTLGERVHYQVLSGNGIYEFDLSDQPDGMYIVRIQSGETIMSRKIIKK